MTYLLGDRPETSGAHGVGLSVAPQCQQALAQQLEYDAGLFFGCEVLNVSHNVLCIWIQNFHKFHHHDLKVRDSAHGRQDTDTNGTSWCPTEAGCIHLTITNILKSVLRMF